MENLIYCKAGLYGSGVAWGDIRLAHLETLVGEILNPPSCILASLTLPALRKLQVPEKFVSPDPVETLVAFVSRSDCTLHEVCITDLSMSADKYREALPSIFKLVAGPADGCGYEESDRDAGSEGEIDSDSDWRLGK